MHACGKDTTDICQRDIDLSFVMTDLACQLDTLRKGNLIKGTASIWPAHGHVFRMIVLIVNWCRKVESTVGCALPEWVVLDYREQFILRSAEYGKMQVLNNRFTLAGCDAITTLEISCLLFLPLISCNSLSFILTPESCFYRMPYVWNRSHLDPSNWFISFVNMFLKSLDIFSWLDNSFLVIFE